MRQAASFLSYKHFDGGVLLTTAIVAILAVTGMILSFVRVPRSRPREAECWANLKYFHTAQAAHLQKQGTYSEKLRDIGFWPERGNRYLYAASLAGTMEGRIGVQRATHDDDVGVLPDVAKHGLKLAAIDRSKLPATFAGGAQLGLTGRCPKDCAITMACVAQLDDDPVLDVWSISTVERKGPDGESIPPGTPFHETADR